MYMRKRVVWEEENQWCRPKKKNDKDETQVE